MIVRSHYLTGKINDCETFRSSIEYSYYYEQGE